MHRIVDLEIWSYPRQATAPHDGKAVAEACRIATSTPHEVVLGLNFVPGEVDISLLASKLAAGETSEPEFKQFCQLQGLPSDVGNQKSAAHFIAFVEGQRLAWLHFPESSRGKDMALLVQRWATRVGHVIRACQGEGTLSEAEVLALWKV
jgi:hypothetical protein